MNNNSFSFNKEIISNSHKLVGQIQALKSQSKYGTMFPTHKPSCLHAKLEQIHRNLDAKAKSALTFFLYQALQ